MKLYHFGLIFIVIAAGFLVTAQIRSVTAMKEEELRRTEYDCLVAAVNAAAGAVFSGEDSRVKASGLQQAEEIFSRPFQCCMTGRRMQPGGWYGGSMFRVWWFLMKQGIIVTAIRPDKAMYGRQWR